MQQTNLYTSNSNNTSQGRFTSWKKIRSKQVKTANNSTNGNNSFSNFFRFCLRILFPVILLISISGYLFTLFFEQNVIFGSEICGAYKVNRIISQSNQFEIPIFGASRAQSGFIPDNLGKEFFNYGMDGTGADVLLMMLTEECKKKNKHSPLIIANLDLEGLRSSVGDICNYLYNANYEPVKQLLRNDFKGYYNFPFIKYYSHYELYTKYYLNDKMQLTKFTNKGASIEKNALTQKKFDEMVSQRKGYATTFMIDTTMSERLLSLIQSHPDRIFVFVVSPYHQSYFEKFTNIEEAKKYLATLSLFKNVRVFDYSDVIYPDNYFVNTTHLNYAGAVAFTKTFKDSLETISSLLPIAKN